jgi:hypothetical protein
MSPLGGRSSDEEIAVHGRASCLYAAPSGVRHARRGCVSVDRHRRSDVLPLEEKVWQPGRGRGAGAPAEARGECAPEARGDGSDARQARPPGGVPKKRLRPARRRALAQWIHDRFQVSNRRACALGDICPDTWYYKSRARDASALRMRIRELAPARPPEEAAQPTLRRRAGRERPPSVLEYGLRA